MLLLPCFALASQGDLQKTQEVSTKTTGDTFVMKHTNVKITDIIEFINRSESQGMLAGAGKTPIASESRLIAYKNLLNTADILLEMGDRNGACQQLHSASTKSDGQPDNQDYVIGQDAPELHEMITVFMKKLQCL